MFKKKPQIKPAAPLRSSDRRKVADSIIRDYALSPTDSSPNDAQSDEQKAEATAAKTVLRNSLLPDNIQTAKFTTTHGPELKQVSGVVYIGTYQGEDVRILWWQVDGRMYPSIYTIWKHPDMLALLFTPGIVVEKMQGGADLMTPGLAGGPPFPTRARKDAIVAISAAEQPATPVAVGLCDIDVSALQQVRGAKGVAVQNLHWAGDELYNFSPSGRPPPPVPESIDGWEQLLLDQETVNKTHSLALDDEDHDDGGVAVSGNAEPSSSKTTEHNESMSSMQKQDNEPVDGSELVPLTQQEIDQAFREAFLYGVHHHKTANAKQSNFGLAFPLSQSFIMSNLIQPFLPTYSPERSQQLQIKKTSWKNIKKFVKSLDKEGIVKSKEKDGHETVILDIDFADPAIVNFKPYRLPKKETASDASTDQRKTEQSDGADDSIGQKIEVKTILKATAQLSPLFVKSDKNAFSSAEVKEAIAEYIAAENLASERNKRMVQLNTTLANAVFDGTGALDQEVLAKGTVPRDALIDRVLKSMAPSYVILRNGADPSTVKARSGAAPKISITLETRSGNKTITKVSGLEAYYVRPKPLAEELRKTCAGSTSVEPLAGATKKNEKPIEEIMIQGPQQEAVIKALEKRGISPKWIEVVDKLKGGSKRWKGR